MQENLVQWTLLKNLNYLSEKLNFEISIKKGQEISTDYGRIDFVVVNSIGRHLIVELETTLNSNAKLDYCFNQILNYKNIKYSNITDYCLLYAEETNKNAKRKIANFTNKNSILERTYSLNEVKALYNDTIERLSLSFGLALPKPANYTICYIRWLNKILKPYYDRGKFKLSREALAHYFSGSNTTNFKCYLRLALDFEMIHEKDNYFELTENGNIFINNMHPDIETAFNLASVNLTNEQKKIILQVLTNGNWTNHKVNVYWFLRFLEITNGEWLPNTKNFEQVKLEIVNGLFGVNYNNRTMFEFLNFACNWCQELELVDRVKTFTSYDKVFLTPLGIELNNIFSLDLQLKKTRLNLNFKYLE